MKGIKSKLPQPFLNFLAENGVDCSVYELAKENPRYIRLRAGENVSLDDLEKAFNATVIQVPWLLSFYELPSNVKIASSQLYKEGKIYGIDLSSGAAVYALNVQIGHHCLDLCCAPGAKLCMLSDAVGKLGSVTGVDIHAQRLSSCRGVLNKYKHYNVRLYNCDGANFSIPAPNQPPRFSFPHAFPEKAQPLTIFYLPSAWGPTGLSSGFYDRVLVDAECTHDASIKHVIKYEKWGWDSFERRLFTPERLASLCALQKRLLQRGFDLLKTGGFLVYSTCSFSVCQNEEVVKDLLVNNRDAFLVKIEVPNLPVELLNQGNTNDEEIRTKTIRFDPVTSRTSGLFIAKVKKLPSQVKP
ncbi:probable 28S rRNA (cytosine(4447)-C(5))-methyltransferase [Zophobas morio]|uniref:probable 28S rRNA (cytosine(4447)-C(5))-methyltransferase n=1 Tax=Zophobas morio TaxID=2755281 RepID=UPI0030827AE6